MLFLVIVCFFTVLYYQILLFDYALKILNNPKEDKVLPMVFAIGNAALALLFYYHAGAFSPYIYLLGIPLYTAQFMLISKPGILQALTGAGIFTLHISTIQVPVIVIASKFYEVTPLALVTNVQLMLPVIIASKMILIFVLQAVKMIMDTQKIKKITLEQKYASLLAVVSINAVAFQTLHAMLMTVDESYPQQVLMTIVGTSTIMFLFYFVFIYSLDIVNVALYKRYSDSALQEQVKIKKTSREIQQKIDTDALTGVFSRRYAMAVLDEICKKEYSPFGLLFIDVNALKTVNDTYGHTSGDRLIAKTAQGIASALREDDILARVGGDEFLAIVHNTDKKTLKVIVDRVQSSVGELNGTEKFKFSISIGAVPVTKEMKDFGSGYILSLADELMRKEKDLFYKKEEVL